ncbi:MAG: alpha/beta fold hydrolase [Ilumatobacteraceae bacterium]
MHRRLGGLAALLLVAVACSSRANEVAEVIDPTLSDDPVAWSDCGNIECGRFTVPLDHQAGETSGVTDLVVYRRRGREGSAPLVLVGPRVRPVLGETRWGARSLAERAELLLGREVNNYDVIAVALRGSHDMPMPDGAEALVGALDVADDLELLRREGLGVDSVRALGWGDGATAVTAWVVQRPGSVKSVVVDSPVDPTRGLRSQEDARLSAAATAAERAVRWCASHLSCPVNASPTDNIELLLERIDQGNAPDGVNETVLARAADVALSAGKPNDLWRAISEAAARRGDVMAGIAGPTLTTFEAAPTCRDAGTAASELLARHDVGRGRYFTVGARRELLALCQGGSWGDRGLGSVAAARAAMNLPVLVMASQTDPVVPATVARSLAEKFEWSWRAATSSRHLVVGVDRAATRAAMAHLSGD